MIILRKRYKKRIVCVLVVLVILDITRGYEMIERGISELFTIIILGIASFLVDISGILCSLLVGVCVIVFIKNRQYRQTEYFIQTHISYLNMLRNKESFEAYRIYKSLKLLSGYKRYLFNSYLSADKVSLILLHESGVYIFESKNYNGRIIGGEYSYWVNKRGSHVTYFCNPVIQNKSHMIYLQKCMGKIISVYSYIVFGNYSMLNDTHTDLIGEKYHIVRLCDLFMLVQKHIAAVESKLSKEEVDSLYIKLNSLVQGNENQKVFYNASVNILKKDQCYQSDYFKQPVYSYFNKQLDKGRIGERYICECLKPLVGYKKYLFNCYLPRNDGTTTEVDIILLHGTGIYVFESKNYSGWIFGTETQQQWTQTLPIGNKRTQKVHFLNPIIQNEVHLKWLKEYIGRTQPCYSYIVFSNRCTLKNITLTSGRHHVLNCKDLLKAIQQNAAITGNRLSKEEIDFLYDKLYPLTQVNERQKRVHIENIQRKYTTKV